MSQIELAQIYLEYQEDFLGSMIYFQLDLLYQEYVSILELILSITLVRARRLLCFKEATFITKEV